MKYTIKNAAISLNGEPILTDINFEITDTSHIAIVGRNGAGKTTLLNALIHNEMLEEGFLEEKFEIHKIGTCTIGYLEQITFNDEKRTLIEEIKKCYPELLELEQKLEKLVKKLEENSSEKTIGEYTTALDRFELLGGYSYQKEYEIMLKKFGFSESDKEKSISSFSGGERTKIAFSKLLLGKQDILLLDEPTNHLDIKAIEWLENYLKDYKKAFIIVSHDRMFLNNTVNTIYDISYKKVTKYIGNYEVYEKQKKENYEKTLKDYERQQKEIERLNALYEKFRAKPTKAKMALAKLHMIERMDKIERPLKTNEKTFKTNLNKMQPSGKNVLSLKDLEVGYDHTLAKFSLEIMQGQKIGVIGANGTGKSTLLKTLAGLIKPIKGHISFGYHVHIGYFDQNLEMINNEHTLLEEFKASFPECLESDARSALGAFLFSGNDVAKKINVLSGGEKVRLQLCKILYQKPNFLILDEPTNHLDLIGKQQLESILTDYKGTILFVSHDRYFVKKIASALIVFDDFGAKFYPYDYETYKEKEKSLEKQSHIELQIIPTKQKKNITNHTSDYKKELAKIDKEITKLEGEKKKWEKELYKEENYTDYQKINDLQQHIEEVEKKLSSLEKKWEETAKKLEEKNML